MAAEGWLLVPDDVVDAADFDAFSSCVMGPSNPVPSGRAGADLDFDLDADLADFAVFQVAFGAGR